MSQTSYSINQAAAQAGQLYDLGKNDFISAVDVVEAVSFGLALVQGTSDGECHLPASSGDIAKILGVSSLVQTKEQALLTSVVNYPIGSDISILRKGRIYVKVEEAVNAMDPVFVRFAAGSFAQLGSFRKSADSASAGQVDGCVYRTSAPIGGFAVVEFNLPA